MSRLVLLVGIALAVAAPREASAGDGKALLPMVAADVTKVFAIDVAEARDAATFQAVLASGWFDQLTGTDPAARQAAMAAVATIVIAGDRSSPLLLAEVTDTAWADAQLAGATEQRHRKVKYRVASGGQAYVRFGKKVAFGLEAEVKAVIDRVKKKAPSLARASAGAALRAGIDATDTRHHVWMVGTGTAAAGLPFTIDAISLGATFGADTTIEVRGLAPDASTAASAKAMIDGFLPQIERALGQLGMTTTAASLALDQQDRVIELDATIASAELQTLITLIASI